MDVPDIIKLIEKTHTRILLQKKEKKNAEERGDEVGVKRCERLIKKYEKEISRLQRKL